MADQGVLMAFIGLYRNCGGFWNQKRNFRRRGGNYSFFLFSFIRKAKLKSYRRFYEATFPRYSPSEFQSHFRMTKTTMETVCREIVDTGRIPLGNVKGRPPMPPEKQVLLFVWCMANQECARLVADRFDVTMCSVDRVLRRVAQGLLELCPRYIKWPSGKLLSISFTWDFNIVCTIFKKTIISLWCLSVERRMPGCDKGCVRGRGIPRCCWGYRWYPYKYPCANRRPRCIHQSEEVLLSSTAGI